MKTIGFGVVFLFVLFILFSTRAFSLFSEEVPPGYLGKVITPNGVSPEQYNIGRAPVWGRDRLILVETSSVHRPAPVKVIMNDRRSTADKNGAVTTSNNIGLEMDFIVNIRFKIKSDKKEYVNALLSDMSLDRSVKSIAAINVYQKYGDMVVGQVSREVLGKYTPEEVMDNLDKINQILDKRIKDKLDNSPLSISSVSLGPIQLPEEITARIKKNKDTEMSELGKIAEQKIAMLDKRNQTALAEQQALREEIDARSLANQNKILNDSITPEVLVLRDIQVREKEIEMMGQVLSKENGNIKTIYIPYGSVGDTAAKTRMFRDN